MIWLFLMEEETTLCKTKNHAFTESKILSITQDLIVNLQHLLSLLDGCSSITEKAAQRTTNGVK
jgi:hypothetical protein